MHQTRVEIGQRAQDEASKMHTGMGDLQTRL
jgi:hypothetical protein